jgi:hypothetical protein
MPDAGRDLADRACIPVSQFRTASLDDRAKSDCAIVRPRLPRTNLTPCLHIPAFRCFDLVGGESARKVQNNLGEELHHSPSHPTNDT